MIADYMTVDEVSGYLKLPEETVYKYARSGRIPASKVGRHWRFERSRIDDWVASRSNQPIARTTVFILDDDPVVSSLYERWLTDDGHEVALFQGGEDLLQALSGRSCDLLLLDLQMPPPNGAEVLSQVKANWPLLNVVIVTAHFDSHLMDEALAIGAITVLRKPLTREQMIAGVAPFLSL